VITFIVVQIASMLLIAYNQQNLSVQVGTEKAADLAKSYFDGVNTMMLTGAMDQKESLREKFLAQPAVQDVRIVRAQGVFSGQTADVTDELDQRALKGETAVRIDRDDKGRVIKMASPIVATANYQGTNCLGCHQVPEGNVVGVVHVQYSLGPLDSEFNHSLLVDGAIGMALSLLGITVVILLLRRIVIAPLLNMRHTMLAIEARSDLSARLNVQSTDEIGHLANTFNAMLEKFRISLGLVADTGRRLSQASEEVTSVSNQTSQAASQQRNETDTTRELIGNLKSLADEVGHSASETANSSVEADQQAVQSTSKTREAITGILQLVRDLEQAAEAIKRLDERSQNVSSVLDVIQGIAEQTNLLALNAAIEAARAGEAGRGFAVVADEVRNLASRSQDSVSSIEEIVAQLQLEARQAVDAMNGARDGAERYGRDLEGAAASLDSIVSRVANIRNLNTRMAEAIAQQGGLTEDVTRRVQTISEIADRTSNDAQRTNGVSEQMVALAHELNQLVNRFKLD
jgi:methyl-accepting chemotaxis protein